MGGTLANPFDSLSGLGVKDPSGAANYTGAPIQFGPYVISGLTATSAATLPVNAGVQTYTTFSVNGGAYGATGNASNGDTLTVKLDLAAYISGFAGPLVYATTVSPKVKVGTVTVTLGAQVCSDPALPPSPPNKVCQ